MKFLFLNTFLIFCSLIVIYYRLEIATKLKILDYPDNKRKIHTSPIPLLGGCIIFFFTITNLFYLTYISEISFKLSAVLTILYSSFFLIGIYDDKYLLSPLKKTIIIIFILLIFLPLDQNLIINEFVFKDFEKIIFLNQGGLFFTLLSIYFLFNFLNFADGINGVAISLCIFWSIIFLVKSNELNYFMLSMIISLAFVLFFNIKNKIFLGNNGSSVLSIIFGSYFVYTYNIEGQIKCDEIFLLMFIPGIDSIRVSLQRIYKQQSPFKGDKIHLHHLLLKFINMKYIFLIYITISAIPFMLTYIMSTVFSLIISFALYFTLFFITNK
jgi:UDP-GlcNAc:undecaprenyl-phosphate GlcNAc-1-phosphate transferase|tara:strand:+ start:400 stop:1377 length:978 start_codon:yes stop_codon:yes gene_type:complete